MITVPRRNESADRCWRAREIAATGFSAPTASESQSPQEDTRNDEMKPTVGLETSGEGVRHGSRRRPEAVAHTKPADCSQRLRPCTKFTCLRLMQGHVQQQEAAKEALWWQEMAV